MYYLGVIVVNGIRAKWTASLWPIYGCLIFLRLGILNVDERLNDFYFQSTGKKYSLHYAERLRYLDGQQFVDYDRSKMVNIIIIPPIDILILVLNGKFVT